MSDRTFSDSIQFQAVLANLEKNNGQLKCALCGKLLAAKSECHFDHILPYAKGGRSALNNCQILCTACNLSKSDKDLRDFVLEEKAKRFMAGESLAADDAPTEEPATKEERITKEKFDLVVGEFIRRNGNIRRVDFTKVKNGLPSVIYVAKFYGSMDQLKTAFGLEIDEKWDRDSIWNRLVAYAKIDPSFRQADLTKKNALPSLPCILSNFPEYQNFSDIRIALGLELNYELWSKEKIVAACREYLKTHRKITQRDLRKENGLPTTEVIYKHFGTMRKFQEEIGSEVSRTQAFLSKEELLNATRELVKERGAAFASRADFLAVFPYSQSVIVDRFGSFDAFAAEAKISFVKTKKAKYTQKEVDDRIIAYVKAGNPIPASAKELSGLGLPSASTIVRFYDDWKEPFLLFFRMLSIADR